MSKLEFRFRPVEALSHGIDAKALSEAQFLAGEDARGAIVILEPETPVGTMQIAALVARAALGFVSDFTPDRFERPDEIPAFAVEGGFR